MSERAVGQSQVTRWKNPTDKVVKVDLFIGIQNKFNAEGKAIGKRSDSFEHVEIQPGEEISILSSFDCAIQQLDNNGIVVGGKAPQLVNMGKPAKVEPCLLGEISMIPPEKETPKTIFVQKNKDK